jgi:tRNA (guanine-N7-)-methyltransferase
MTNDPLSDPGVLSPGVRTFKPRRSRITPRQRAALREPRWLLPAGDVELDLATVFGSELPVVLEIGFGTGEATAELAASESHTDVLAVDIHTPGVGNLLDLLDRSGLTNVRVMEADGLLVLKRMIAPGALSGVRSYFPDPWPKARHHKRRLVQPRVLDLVADRLRTDGFWHLATDWAEYADAIAACFAEHPRWTGGPMDRPPWRPVTRYERRALREGRDIVDLMFRTVAD